MEYKCSICGSPLKKIKQFAGNVSFAHFYALPTLEVLEDGEYRRSSDKSLFLTAYGCTNKDCSHIVFFAAKRRQEI